MIIWRGWGGLAVAYAALALMLCLGLASTVLPTSALPFTTAGGLLVAAVATWLTGRALNVTRPQRRIDAWYPARERQVRELVDAGRFTLGPGQPPPRSHAEAQEQGRLLLDHELRAARRGLNLHTLFFIPLQFWAIPMALGAVAALVMGVSGLLAS